MRTKLFALLMLALPVVASAQNSPVGRWKTFDEETGKVMTIAEVYQAQNGKLAAKIVKGGSGVWGPVPMPANAQVNDAEAKKLAAWVLTQK